ncbi:MAG: hypothetical protein ACOXZM_09910 [Eubacteriales bacterium]|jgi:hypothetical protein
MALEKSKNGQVFIWMQLLGFNRDDPDRGVERFLNQTGFIPDGACALLFHPDFVNQHRGMETEYTLPPDNCAYYGIPRNAERERQPWTNYDLRTLSRNLNTAGSGLWAGIMGSSLNNAFHQEWISDHPELYKHRRGGGRGGHDIFKRFVDGTYYEDYFIDQLCKALVDYDMKGVHLADGFCPRGNIVNGDFSTDLTEQFLDATGLTLPDGIMAGLGDDSAEVEDARADWIWKALRSEWIEFQCDRWVRFFQKLCKRVHEVGRQVMILGMYCTDPFETKYCLGMDLARVMAAGVDYITENILPTSVYVAGNDRPYYFHRYMGIAPTTAAHVRDGHLISMLGVQDASEEWDMMHHQPCLHERDMYTMMAYRLEGAASTRALEGFFLCLGDGIKRSDWDWEHKRLEIAMSADVEKTLSPVMLWSDAAYQKMLSEYIRTRRWTPFKLFYELSKAGMMPGGCVRGEDLGAFSGTLIVPDFDMLSEKEQKMVAAYDRGAVLVTVKAGFDAAAWGLKPTLTLIDRWSDRPLTAYLLNAEVTDETRAKVETLLASDDGTPNITGDPADLTDHAYTLNDTLVFSKVTTGFRDAMAAVLADVGTALLTCDKPYLAYRLKNGNTRLYLFNDNKEHYRRAFVTMREPVEDTLVVSSFPILPVRYKESASGGLTHIYNKTILERQSFEVKLQPGGVTILDVIPKR